jgi:hypothetical protein
MNGEWEKCGNGEMGKMWKWENQILLDCLEEMIWANGRGI